MMRQGSVVGLVLLFAAVSGGCVSSSGTPIAATPTGGWSACGAASVNATNVSLATPLNACATPVPTGPPGGLSKDEAIAIVLRLAPPSSIQPTVSWALPSPYYLEPPLVPIGTWVWTIRLLGGFEATACSSALASPRPCGPAASALVIIIDYYSGAFIQSSAED
jgi:hypothetical protein